MAFSTGVNGVKGMVTRLEGWVQGRLASWVVRRRVKEPRRKGALSYCLEKTVCFTILRIFFSGLSFSTEDGNGCLSISRRWLGVGVSIRIVT